MKRTHLGILAVLSAAVVAYPFLRWEEWASARAYDVVAATAVAFAWWTVRPRTRTVRAPGRAGWRMRLAGYSI